MQTSAFDRVLRIPHLLQEVFEYFAPEWSQAVTVPNILNLWDSDRTIDRVQYHMLAGLARVCKAFVDPAVNILWRNLEDIDPLSCILRQHSDYDVAGDITPQQWSRFREYARRVCRLRFICSREVRGNRKVWSMLEDHSSSQPLLPRLRTLVVHDIDAAEQGAWMLLLSPSLRTLRMSFIEGSLSAASASRSRLSATESLFPLVAAAIPDLTEFWIEGGLPEDLPPRYLFSLARLKRLEKLNTIYSGAVVDHEALQCISHMTALRNVELRICFDGIGPSDSLQLGEAFDGLTNIHISGSIHDIRRLFKAIRCPNLTSFVLTISAAPTMKVLKDSLAEACDRVSKSISEAHIYVSAHIDSPDISLGDILQPYLPFREMASMEMEFDHHIPCWNDEDMLAFANAWPLLKSFFWSCGVPDPLPLPLPSQPTVAGVVELARRCPRLEYLTLPLLDVRTLPRPRDVPPVGHKSMQSLDVGRYIGGETANLLDLAVILDVLFPRLKRQRCCIRAKDGVSLENTDADCLPVRMTDLLLSAFSARRELLDGTSTADASGALTGRDESAQIGERDSNEEQR